MCPTTAAMPWKFPQVNVRRFLPRLRTEAHLERLFDDDAACLDRTSPLLGFALDERSEILRCATIRSGNLRAEAAQSLTHRRRFRCLDGSIVELLDDFRGCVPRKEERVPGIGFEALGSLLKCGGDVGKRGRSHGIQESQCPDRAAVDLRFGGSDGLTHEVDATCHEILCCRSGTTIGDVRYVGAKDVVEQDAGKMRRGAGTG